MAPDLLATGDGAAIEAAAAGDSAESPAHALVLGLRTRRDEGQLTNLIGAIARSDGAFARAFAEGLLVQVRADCPGSADQLARLGSLPGELSCVSERTLHDDHGRSLGRADLVFESTGDDPFVLVVENKLYSGFGEAQLERYQAGLRVVLGHGGRGGLVALTRDVPTAGELQAGEHGWLGSVRWAKFLPRLRTLPVSDPGVAMQWLLLLDVLEQQGDLGMTGIDADAVRAWSRYFEGRQQLQWLIEQVFAHTLEHTRAALAAAHRGVGKRAELAALWYKPRARKVLIQHSQSEIQFGISVPASYTEQTVSVGVWMEDPGEIGFGVTVAPRDADRFFEKRDPDLLRQVRVLTSAGFEQVGAKAEWYSSHRGSDLLEADDAPTVLLESVKTDITVIAESKILDYDLRQGVPTALRRKKGEPWG